MKCEVLRFLRFMLLPSIFGIGIAMLWLYDSSSGVVILSFVANFIIFLTMFLVRAYRFRAREHLFKASVTPSLGLFLELVILYVLVVTDTIAGSERWVFALYMAMSFILDVGLFAYALAVKALTMARKEEEDSKR